VSSAPTIALVKGELGNILVLLLYSALLMVEAVWMERILNRQDILRTENPTAIGQWGQWAITSFVMVALYFGQRKDTRYVNCSETHNLQEEA
jgi:hypothetical protein